MSIGKILCWLGLHNRGGWKTDYSVPYAPAFGAFFPDSAPINRIRKYRAFNRCQRCGNVKCEFVNG